MKICEKHQNLIFSISFARSVSFSRPQDGRGAAAAVAARVARLPQVPRELPQVRRRATAPEEKTKKEGHVRMYGGGIQKYFFFFFFSN